MLAVYTRGMMILGAYLLLKALVIIVSLHFAGIREFSKDSLKSAVIPVLIDIPVIYIVEAVLSGTFNPVGIVKQVFFFSFSYQSLIFIPEALLIETIVLAMIGRIYGLIMKTGSRGPLFTRGILGILTVIALVIMSVTYVSFSGEYRLRISEIQPDPELIWDRNVYSEYIELYNSGSLNCELRELYLSDDPGNLHKHRINDSQMTPHSRMIESIDDENFRISSSGKQTIYLSDSHGNVLDMVETDTILTGESYTLMDDMQTWKSMAPSPYMPGDEAVPVTGETMTVSPWVEAPSASVGAGFYDEPFYVELSAGDGCSIYYTTDGSRPDTGSSEYRDPIYAGDHLTDIGAFVLRAIAVDSTGTASEPMTATYFIGADGYREYPVVSIAADPDAVWGDDGILVSGRAYDEWLDAGGEGDPPMENFYGSGMGYEVPASFEYMDAGDHFSQNMGLRVSGGSAREADIKRLALFARKEYSGSDIILRPLYDGIYSHKVVIRDSYINPIVMDLSRTRDVAVLDSIRTNVFLNGEFYCQAAMMEKYDDTFFAQHYGVREGDVEIMTIQLLEDGIESPAVTEWQELYEFIEDHDLSDPEVYAEFCTMVDVQSYIDSLCIRTYIDDCDYTETKNVYIWKTVNSNDGYDDGRWRWCLYDLDAFEWAEYERYGVSSQAEKNTFEIVGDFTGDKNVFQYPMFLALYENEDFRRQFVISFMDIANTVFRYENVVDCIEDYGSDTTGYWGHLEPEYYLDFFRDRYGYIVPYMAEKFGLHGTLEEITVTADDPAGGDITVNTAQISPDDGAFTGGYYTDYPVTLSAEAREGYRFAGWTGDIVSEDEEIEITLKEGGMAVNAVFEKE